MMIVKSSDFSTFISCFDLRIIAFLGALIMRLLVISDTHENVRVLDALQDVTGRLKPEVVIHCGDFISPIIIRRLLRLDVDIQGVFGNNDGDVDTISRLVKGSRILIESQPKEIEINGERALVLHGWKSVELTRRMVKSLALGGDYRYIFYGHTHNVELSIIKNRNYQVLQDGYSEDTSYKFKVDEFDSLVLNPGEASGILTGISTYASLEVTRDYVLVEIKRLEV